MSRSVRITRILSMTDRVAAALQGLHFTGFAPPSTAWQPAVNVYAQPTTLEVCVDLAGVCHKDIVVHAEPRRLLIRGRRDMPDCGRGEAGCGRLLVMEIPDGTFERVLEFTVEIDPQRVQARWDNGWLWISLPRAGKEARP
jgi:HSP20 family molecular chaperone IbpA